MKVTKAMYAKVIQDVERIAMRDISMNGEFSNPYHPIDELIEYRAYETVRRHYYDCQMDIVFETLKGELQDESPTPSQQL